MIGRIKDIFSKKDKRDKINQGDTDIDLNDLDSIDNTIDNILSDLNQLIIDTNCNHQWVDYDEEVLKNLNLSNRTKINHKIEKLLVKKINKNSDILIDRMLDMLVVMIPPNEAVYGTCMVCGQRVLIFG